MSRLRALNCKPWEIRAFLSGTKTQIRRLVKPTTKDCTVGAYVGEGGPVDVVNVDPDGDPWTDILCPLGQPGDILWCREAWAPYGRTLIYRADYSQHTPISDGIGGPWRSAATMPLWACRLKVEVTGVRVERLDDIDDRDARMCGVKAFGGMCPAGCPYRYGFIEQWMQDYGTYNPADWCWVADVVIVKASGHTIRCGERV